jgi:hypothetical protein
LLGLLHRQELVEDVGDPLVAVLALQAVAAGRSRARSSAA